MAIDSEVLNEQLEMSRERTVLTLEIPIGGSSEPSSSAPSSEPPSPNPLADSDTLTPHNTSSETPPSSTSTHSASTHTSASSSSLPSTTLSVKFAPLPELAPRKRRSNTPLGMAARSQLMRKRRGHYNAQQQQLLFEQQQQALNPGWTAEEFEAHRLKQEELAARYAHYQASAAALAAREDEAQLEEEEEEMERHQLQKLEKAKAIEDGEVPILTLGKSVKTLWRKVAHLDAEGAEAKLKERDRHKEKVKGKDDSVGLKRRKSDVGRRSHDTSSSPRTSTPPPVPPPPMRPILAPITSSNFQEIHESFEPPEPSEEGGVWEEEIGDAFPLNVSQTETIVEGRPMYSLAKAGGVVSAKAEVQARPQSTKADPAHRSSVLVKSPRNPPVKSKSLVTGKS